MILDDLKNASNYYTVSEGIKTALKYLKENDVSKLKPGDYEIDGSRIYVKVRHYQTKLAERCAWEAHHQYIDVQYVAEGEEYIGYANIKQMKTKEYLDEKDLVVLEGEGDFFKSPEGSFAIFFPDDVHMPGVTLSESRMVKKVIVKVKV